jgi:LAS superfamily LD-carboxypeptidase LdcB
MLVTSLANFNSTSCTLGQEGANNQGCSTSVTQGLTSQILSELTAMGLTFKEIDNEFIQCNVPCVNQLQAAAADALASAASAKGEVLVLNSATRSSAQQYLLYQWYLGGICGIGLAAKPGTSNHEGGRAVDTSAYNEWYVCRCISSPFAIHP